jgi:hypothetical protein
MFFRGRRFFLLLFLLLLLLLLPQVAATVELTEADLAPYLEKYATGWIDWDNGYVYGIGIGYLDNNNQSRPRALGAARVVASGNIVKLAAGIHLDDRKTLESLGAGRVIIELKAFLQYEEVNKELVDANRPHFKVVYRVPFHGISGMTSRLLRGLEERPSDWTAFPRAGSGKEDDVHLPWLVLDARDVNSEQQLTPALFPKIVSAKGETVYELSNVDKEALVQRGMASYVLSGVTGNISSNAGRPLARIIAELNDFLSLSAACAEERGKRAKREQFIVKKVEDLQGLTRTNLVISEKDAQELKKEDAASQILEKCRVIIIVSSPIGGIEAHFAPLFAQVP